MAEAVLENRLVEGRIGHERTRRWAELFNLRYRLLLGCLLHTFHRDAPLYSPNGDRTAKGLLQYWTFSEMRRVKKIAEKLVQMPKDQEGTIHAGPPFELPYTLSLSQFEADRWRTHADVLNATQVLTATMQKSEPDASDPFLKSLHDSDGNAHRIALALAVGDPIPPNRIPSGFQKVLTTLEEAVRGFEFTPRHAVQSPTRPQTESTFWRDRSRDAFLALEVWGERVVVEGDPEASALLKRIALPPGDSSRMPRHRPRIPQERIDHVRVWIEAGASDDTPF
jgi:hypothetical protein